MISNATIGLLDVVVCVCDGTVYNDVCLHDNVSRMLSRMLDDRSTGNSQGGVLPLLCGYAAGGGSILRQPQATIFTT